MCTKVFVKAYGSIPAGVFLKGWAPWDRKPIVVSQRFQASSPAHTVQICPVSLQPAMASAPYLPIGADELETNTSPPKVFKDTDTQTRI